MDDVTECGLERLLDELLDREGGNVDRPADRGGPTRFGISKAVGFAGAPLPPDEATAGLGCFRGCPDRAANGRTVDAIAIVERCEAREREALKRARAGWWARVMG